MALCLASLIENRNGCCDKSSKEHLIGVIGLILVEVELQRPAKTKAQPRRALKAASSRGGGAVIGSGELSVPVERAQRSRAEGDHLESRGRCLLERDEKPAGAADGAVPSLVHQGRHPVGPYLQANTFDHSASLRGRTAARRRKCCSTSAAADNCVDAASLEPVDLFHHLTKLSTQLQVENQANKNKAAVVQTVLQRMVVERNNLDHTDTLLTDEYRQLHSDTPNRGARGDAR